MSFGRKLVYLLPILAFLVLFVLFLQGIGSVSESTLTKQQESLETALGRSISQCYAVEGCYPPSLEYLEQHYGLLYDKNSFSLTMNTMAATFFRKSPYSAEPALTKGVSDIMNNRNQENILLWISCSFWHCSVYSPSPRWRSLPSERMYTNTPWKIWVSITKAGLPCPISWKSPAE